MSTHSQYLPPCIPLPVEENELIDVIDRAKDWAVMHGAAMRSKTNFDADTVQFAPFILVPSTFRRQDFDNVVEVQIVFNELVHNYTTVENEGGSAQRVALGLLRSDYLMQYTRKSNNKLKQVEVNTIASSLAGIATTITQFHRYVLQELGHHQKLQNRVALGLLRSDYLMQYTRKSNNKLKQVEVNTIASSLAGIATTITQFHRYVLQELGHHQKLQNRVALGLLRSDYLMQYTRKSNNKLKQVEVNTIASSLAGIATTITQFHRYVLQELGHHQKLQNIPDNNALLGLCQGMLDAWMIYGDSKAVILFIVEDVTYNICDQRFHEFEIQRLNPNVKIIRRTLTEIGQRASLASNKELVVDNFVVSVVYFRAGYEPNHYPTNLEWDARLLIERSKAIKCPTIQYHLAGTKKVQQELSKPGAVERFITDLKKAEAVRDFFVRLYGLEFDELGDKAVEMALKEPERFVLKPQREGGGNNIYGADIKEALFKIKDNNERTAWILMERIFPPIIKGYMIRPGGPKVPAIVEIVSELGIFGVVIGDSQNITVNRQVGHMLRTKVSTANEGGVATGSGALDSPYLVD